MARPPSNAGLNHWSFDTNVAATYLHDPTGTEASVNVGHIFNTENPDTDYRSGQELHLDWMLNQYLGEDAAVGVHGFYYEQITGDTGAGAVLGDFTAEAAGLGPAVLWTPKIRGLPVSLIARWLREVHAERRFQGDHVLFSVELDL